MKIGVPMEPDGETRVAIVPGSMKKLSKAGFEVVVEKGAGVAANYLDTDYSDAGATVADRSAVMDCDIIISIRMVDVSELKKGQIIACVADPFRAPENVQACIDVPLCVNGITGCTGAGKNSRSVLINALLAASPNLSIPTLKERGLYLRLRGAA